MKWMQVYDPFGDILLSAAVAALPLIFLLYMLGVRRSPGHLAALTATGSALVLAIIAYQMPVALAINSTIYGLVIGLFPIVWIVINAIWIYNMTVESGEFDIIKNSLANLTDDRRLQAVFVAFAVVYN